LEDFTKCKTFYGTAKRNIAGIFQSVYVSYNLLKKITDNKKSNGKMLTLRSSETCETDEF